MKNVIAVKGISNVGKTSSIVKAYERLIAKHPSAKVEKIPGGNRNEISAIVTIGKIKIGIESQGDPGQRLPNSIQEFVNRGCQIILCTTRTRGGTVDLIKSLEPPYKIAWLLKEKSKSTSEIDTDNSKMAKDIFKLVDNLMSA